MTRRRVSESKKTKRYRRAQSHFGQGRRHNRRRRNTGCRDARTQEEVNLREKGRSAAKEVKTRRVVSQDKVKVRFGVTVGGESQICINIILHPSLGSED